MIAHQNAFATPRNLGRAGLLQIATPIRKESVAAATSISAVFDHATSAFVDPFWAQMLTRSVRTLFGFSLQRNVLDFVKKNYLSDAAKRRSR